MNIKAWVSLAICASLAALTIWTDRSHWLGGENISLLSVLGVLHLVASIAILWWVPSGNAFKVAVIGLLVIGQLWGIELIAMIAIWKAFGFNR